MYCLFEELSSGNHVLVRKQKSGKGGQTILVVWNQIWTPPVFYDFTFVFQKLLQSGYGLENVFFCKKKN